MSRLLLSLVSRAIDCTSAEEDIANAHIMLACDLEQEHGFVCGVKAEVWLIPRKRYVYLLGFIPVRFYWLLEWGRWEMVSHALEIIETVSKENESLAPDMNAIKLLKALKMFQSITGEDNGSDSQ